jgi:NADH:ubiquinone oxidoreductase subunit K
MTDLSLTLHAAIALVALGLGAAVARRSFFVVVVAGLARAEPRLIAAALVALLLVAAFAVASVAVGLAVYRRRGAENLDELTELSG